MKITLFYPIRHTLRGCLFLCWVVLCQPVQAQHIEREVAATAGGTQQALGFGSLQWTLGEPVIETRTQGSVRLTQGFHQLFVTTVDTGEPEAGSLVFNVFPNPTASTLHIETAHSGSLDWQLLDVSGRLLATQSLQNADDPSIDLQAFPAGVYLLRIGSGPNAMRTFKVVKTAE
jgi:hypothetical protein